MAQLSRARLEERARAWGVDPAWEDFEGRCRAVPSETLAAILDVLGAGSRGSPRRTAGPMVLRQGETPPVARGVLRLEDGGERVVGGRLPGDLPLGYHSLLLPGGRRRAVVVSPGRCHLPADLRGWGWAVQLYAMRSERSWGIGDLGDLRDLARWSAGALGTGLLLLNPLHHSSPVPPIPASPYSPGSRRFRDPLWLRVEDVPGASALGSELLALAAAGHHLNALPRIERDHVFRLKMDALARIHASAPAPPELDAWRASQGGDLDAFGTWCALAEVHGPGWRSWAAPLQDRWSREVAAEASRLRPRAEFHVWLQWLVDRQLAAASAEVPLLHDLAIGVSSEGADAWLWREQMATGVHVGAPPDLFNSRGQDWGIAPFDPWRLRAADYRPFVETMRACMRSAGGLRVDHVMGLSRLYWIPPGGSPLEGAYVRFPARDLFLLLALESHRAGALVVGEDLGTVEPSVREAMAEHDVLSYRLLWFEREPPSAWPERALAAVTTHDLPTVAGLWTGADLAAQERAETSPDGPATAELRERLRAMAGLEPDAPVDAAVLGAYAALASAPSALLVATLDDALAVEERPNMPGTTAERWPSWSLPLPATLEQLMREPRARSIAALLSRGGGSGAGGG